MFLLLGCNPSGRQHPGCYGSGPTSPLRQGLLCCFISYKCLDLSFLQAWKKKGADKGEGEMSQRNNWFRAMREKPRAGFGADGVLLSSWLPFSTVSSFLLSSIRDMETRPDLPLLTEAAASAVSGEERTVLGTWVQIHTSPPPFPIPPLCTGSTLNTAVAPGKLHQGPLSIGPPLYGVHDPHNGAIWTLRAAFRGYRGEGDVCPVYSKFLLVARQPGLSLCTEKSEQNYAQVSHVMAWG